MFDMRKQRLPGTESRVRVEIGISLIVLFILKVRLIVAQIESIRRVGRQIIGQEDL